jgi:hypothetical protein
MYKTVLFHTQKYVYPLLVGQVVLIFIHDEIELMRLSINTSQVKLISLVFANDASLQFSFMKLRQSEPKPGTEGANSRVMVMNIFECLCTFLCVVVEQVDGV